MFLALSAAAVGLAGCTREPTEPAPPSAPAPSSAPTDPDASVRARVAASEVALIAAYRSALAASPGLAADLEPILAHHEVHLARVAPDLPEPSGSPGASSPSAPSTAPGTRAVLAELAAAESAAQGQRATACDGAQDPALARDLCLIAASEAQHAAVLDGLAAGRSES